MPKPPQSSCCLIETLQRPITSCRAVAVQVIACASVFAPFARTFDAKPSRSAEKRATGQSNAPQGAGRIPWPRGATVSWTLPKALHSHTAACADQVPVAPTQVKVINLQPRNIVRACDSTRQYDQSHVDGTGSLCAKCQVFLLPLAKITTVGRPLSSVIPKEPVCEGLFCFEAAGFQHHLASSLMIKGV